MLAHTKKKQTTPRLDISNYNSLYGVFEIGIVGLGYNLCILSTHANNCTAGVHEFGEFELHRQLVSVSYNTVKHAKYHC